MRWDSGRGAEAIRHNTGEGNGCTLDREGRRVSAKGANRQTTRMDVGCSGATIADRWHGKRLNRPNDIVCRSDGSIISPTRN